MKYIKSRHVNTDTVHQVVAFRARWKSQSPQVAGRTEEIRALV